MKDKLGLQSSPDLLTYLTALNSLLNSSVMYTYPHVESTTWSGNEAVAYGTGIGSVSVLVYLTERTRWVVSPLASFSIIVRPSWILP